MTDVVKVPAPDCVFIIRQNYVGSMLARTAFDNIVHAHLENHALGSLENVLNRHALEVLDVLESDVNGGSFRTYVRRRGDRVGAPDSAVRVEEIRAGASHVGLDTAAPYRHFASDVRAASARLEFVTTEVASGRACYFYGASTRGNTLLHSAGLEHRHIAVAAVRNPEK